ncbi:Amidophosphoribosyltransferase [bacterium HR17]|uniref:Amidophosphoribosyltransferase n=1 Tax=Candidatus Fervidibacter japonicus TaxID=2035412 RepID=A0A2H5XDP4_9BACT|nr:Amidophosphoribosyltransferase [bacterium HR17]
MSAQTGYAILSEGLPEECGVFGVYAPGDDVARIAYFGLFALQHRGQESAGIAVADGRTVKVHKRMGLVSQVFDEETLSGMQGHIAIGHTRYSTTGASNLANAQPLLEYHRGMPFALGHNGNLVNALELRRGLERLGFRFDGTSDSEIIAKLVASLDELDFERALMAAVRQLRGAFSLVLMTPTQLFAVRDPYGVRPLVVGKLNGSHWVIASETCALNPVGAVYVRDVEPGELVVVDDKGLHIVRWTDEICPALCLFEFVYLARPDSHLYQHNVHMARRRMGQILAQEHPADADIVIPVPDTGIPAAIGYAEASGIPYAEGFIKNRYIHRTFIQPSQRQRELGVRIKLTPIREVLEGKRVVVVEDSIVRGTTTRAIVAMLREAGAKEIHVRVSSPPYRFPCFYGIDTCARSELIAAQLDEEEIRRYIGADSLGYLSLEGLLKAVGGDADRFCRACFDGKYPIPIPEHLRLSKHLFETDELLPVHAGEQPRRGVNR